MSKETEKLDALAAQLDLDLDDMPICLACLGIVSMAIDHGDAKEVAREVRSMTPHLWAEGLAEPAIAALERASARGVPGADVALAAAERSWGQSGIAKAIVRRLATELSRRVHHDLKLEEVARERLPFTKPELN
jgi:hypothetical protein